MQACPLLPPAPRDPTASTAASSARRCGRPHGRRPSGGRRGLWGGRSRGRGGSKYGLKDGRPRGSGSGRRRLTSRGPTSSTFAFNMAGGDRSSRPPVAQQRGGAARAGGEGRTGGGERRAAIGLAAVTCRGAVRARAGPSWGGVPLLLTHRGAMAAARVPGRRVCPGTLLTVWQRRAWALCAPRALAGCSQWGSQRLWGP